MNQCLLDSTPGQTESLLQPHQARAYGVIVNDVAKTHSAADKKQGAQNLVVDGITPSLNFDGWKCYFNVRNPTTEKIKNLPKFLLTNELPYLPQRSVAARNVKIRKVDTINKWRAQLGHPTYTTTSAPLNNTTQLVQTLQVESREYMRDYYKTRAWALDPNRINDILFSDTFSCQFYLLEGMNLFDYLLLRKLN